MGGGASQPAQPCAVAAGRRACARVRAQRLAHALRGARTRDQPQISRATRGIHCYLSRADASQCDLSRVCWPRTSFLRDILSAAAVAAQRAGGGLVRLKLPGAERGMARLLAGDGKKCLLPEDVLPVCTRHMLELRGATAASPTATQWTPAQLRRLAAAAPALVLAQLDVRVDSAADATQLFATGCGLRGALQLRTLHVSPCDASCAQAQWTHGALRALCAGAAAADVHTLHFSSMSTPLKDPESLAALCAAAAASRLRRLGFLRCGLNSGSWRHLAAALSPDGALEELLLVGDPVLDATADEVAPFAAAMPAARLTRLHVELATGPDRFGVGPAAATALLAAAVGHATLRRLILRGCPAIRGAPEEALSAALAALAETLHLLDLGHCELGDDVLAPLVAAITQPSCTLQWLRLAGSRMSKDFERGALLDAAENAVPTLQELLLVDWDSGPSGKLRSVSAAAQDAQAAVQRRAERAGLCNGA